MNILVRSASVLSRCPFGRRNECADDTGEEDTEAGFLPFVHS